MSEITNPPPDGSAAAQGAASRYNRIANPPLDGGEGVALDDHLNPNPNAVQGSAGPAAGTAAVRPIENPPPWAAEESATPEREAPSLGPLNPPTRGSSEAAAPKTAKRSAPAKRKRK